jgi:hypothetical protein
MVTQQAFGYRFDYLGSILAKGDASAGAISFYQGPYGVFGIKNIVINFSTLFGLNFFPWQLVPLIKDPAVGGVISDQSNGLLKWILVVSFAYVLIKSIRKGGENYSVNLIKKSLYLCIAYIIFSSLLAGRHVPYITGYYYACAWPVLFTVLVSTILLFYIKSGQLGKKFILIVVLGISLIQINNFYSINESWISLHNNQMIYPNYKNKFNLTTEKANSENLNLILLAWKENRLNELLRSSYISSGEVYLACDLDWLNNQKLLNSN